MENTKQDKLFGQIDETDLPLFNDDGIIPPEQSLDMDKPLNETLFVFGSLMEKEKYLNKKTQMKLVSIIPNTQFAKQRPFRCYFRDNNGQTSFININRTNLAQMKNATNSSIPKDWLNYTFTIWTEKFEETLRDGSQASGYRLMIE